MRQTYQTDRDQRDTARARAAFVEIHGEAQAAARQAQIEALPLVTWNGKPFRTLRCHGTSGKGPHDQNVREGLLWALIDLRRWCCAFHPGELT